MTRSRIISAAMLTAVLAAGGIAASIPSASAIAADSKGPTVRPEVGKPLQAAQAALKAGNAKGALQEIQAAEAISNKTPYENYVIAAMKASAYLSLKDYPNAMKALEAKISSGMASPQEIVPAELAIAEIAFDSKDYNTFNEYAAKYYKDGGTDERLHQLGVQAAYVQGDFATVSKQLHASVTAQEKAGGKPSEDVLKMWMSAEYKMNPASAGYQQALFGLVQYYPNKDYWSDAILSVRKTPGYSEKLDLDVARIRTAVGVMKDEAAYVDAAQEAIDAGLPGEAKNFMDKGTAAGLVGQGSQAARDKRLSDMASNLSAQDQKTLSGELAAAGSNASALLKVGDAFLSYGQYDQAVTAYTQAISKGNFKTPIEANIAKLHLGIAYLNQGQKPKAKDTFKGVTGADGTGALAQLWATYAGQ